LVREKESFSEFEDRGEATVPSHNVPDSSSFGGTYYSCRLSHVKRLLVYSKNSSQLYGFDEF
jgi:hypothetical protein